MALIKKTFEFEETPLNVIKNDDEIWFRGKTVATILGYKNTKDALSRHVDEDDKSKLGDFCKGRESRPLKKNEKNTIFINESGLYSLVLKSKLKKAKQFKRWVTKEVLPSIRKTGGYKIPNLKEDEIEERRLQLEEFKVYSIVYQNIDDCQLQSVIKDWMINKIQDKKAITDGNTISNEYARDITDICKSEFGFTPNFTQKIQIGQLLKKAYTKEFNETLPKCDKYVNGQMRKVNCYPKNKEQWIIDTLKEFGALAD